MVGRGLFFYSEESPLMADDKVKAAPLRPIPITIDGEEIVAYPKVFKTGTQGWHATRKVTIDGREVQVNCLMYLPDTVAKKTTEQNSTSPQTAPEAPPSPPKKQGHGGRRT